VREALRGWFEAWDSISYQPTELIDADDEVLAFVGVTARGRASGAGVSYGHGQLWTLRDGLVVRMRVFGDREAALRAAGLSE
jgi:ketosteroid isomerase-like protein